jgi:hypothetical protein
MAQRRAFILALVLFAAGPAIAETRPRRRRAKVAATAQAHPPPPLPDIDAPPPPSRIPGLEPAPVPASNPRRPLADGMAQPSLAFGVPTPPLVALGETFRANDPSPDTRAPGNGLRLPSPGATLRLPF